MKGLRELREVLKANESHNRITSATLLRTLAALRVVEAVEFAGREGLPVDAGTLASMKHLEELLAAEM